MITRSFFLGITVVLITSCSYAQELFKFKLKVYYNDESSNTDSIYISYDINYPFYYNKKILLVKHQKVLTSGIDINVPCLEISINGIRVVFNPGDTISFRKTESSDYELSEKAGSYFSYNKIKRKLLTSNGYTSPDYNVKPFDTAYLKSRLQYMYAEMQFIDSLLPQSKNKLNTYLKDRAKHAYVFDIISFLKKMNLAYTEFMKYDEEADRLFDFLKKPNLPFDYNFRIGLINYIEWRSGLTGYPLKPDEIEQMRSVANYFKSSWHTFYVNSLLFERVSRNVTPDNYRVGRLLYNSIINNKLSHSYTKIINEKYQPIVTMSHTIKKYFNNTLKSINGQRLTFRNTLNNSKYLVIDFWASWCAPCISLLPTLDSIKRIVKDVQVLKISIDKSEAQWIKVSKKLNQNSGNFLYGNNKISLVQDFGITEIPRILIFETSSGQCINSNYSLSTVEEFVLYLQGLSEK